MVSAGKPRASGGHCDLQGKGLAGLTSLGLGVGQSCWTGRLLASGKPIDQ